MCELMIHIILMQVLTIEPGLYIPVSDEFPKWYGTRLCYLSDDYKSVEMGWNNEVYCWPIDSEQLGTTEFLSTEVK